jgi:hypothetical protein
MLYPPPPWTNAPVRLYHGTSERHAQAIVAGDVDVSVGRRKPDFGPGFYTTSFERQAQTWAYQLVKHERRSCAAVVAIDVDRDALARLHTLAFVRGDFDAEDFWSFVVHCRTGGATHARSGPNARYDVVLGPVASFWQQRLLIQGVDQVSFHTPAAERVLNSSRRFVAWTSSR